MKLFTYLILSVIIGLSTFSSLSHVQYFTILHHGDLPLFIFLSGLFLSVLVLGLFCLFFKMNMHYKHQLDAKTKLLEQQKNLAEQSNESKSQFLTKMSHDLRTPLNSILLLSDLLINDGGDEIALNKRNEYNQMINVSANILFGLLNDLLDISKIESGILDIFKEKIVIEDLASEIQKSLEPQAHKKGLTFSVEIKAKGCVLYVDKKILFRILFNIIGNAIKFTDKGFVKIIFEEDSSHWVFRVIDSGCGIKIENQNKIFELFRLDEKKETNSKKGFGLGLGIAKKMAETLNGTIELNSKVGEGSAFIVSIKKIDSP